MVSWFLEGNLGHAGLEEAPDQEPSADWLEGSLLDEGFARSGGSG